MKCQLTMWRGQDQTHTWFLHGCVFSKILLFATLLPLWECFRSSCIKKVQTPLRATLAGHPAFLPLLLGSITAPSTILHSPGSWLLLCSVFVQHQKCLHVPGTKQSCKSHPQCQGWVLESPLTAHISVCPAANTWLLTLIDRNFVSPGDGCWVYK